MATHKEHCDKMRIGFVNSHKDVDIQLSSAFGMGLINCGENSFNLHQIEPDTDDLRQYDLVCVIGVKSVDIVRRLLPGQKWLYFDKPYNRQWPNWWRVSVSSHQPTDYLLQRNYSPERARAQKWLPLPEWRSSSSGYILIAGASAKYHRFQMIAEPTIWAREVVKHIRRYSQREIVYRPKQSWKDAVPVAGTTFRRPDSRISIEEDLRNAYVMVTHGSAAALDALRAGVPSVILGNAVTRDISSTSWSEIEEPRRATMDERERIVTALAHYQWTLDEITKGDMWKSLASIIKNSI